MRATAALCQQAIRLTLFTRAHCSLCVDAKNVLSKVWDRRPFDYDEVDVMAAKREKWKALYEFDTPVVRPDPRKTPFRFTERVWYRFTSTRRSRGTAASRQRLRRAS